MVDVPQATKAKLRSFRIQGHDIAFNVDLGLHLNKLMVFETVCKPYITAKCILIDTNNILTNMNIVGAEPVSFAFDGGGHVYDYIGQIIKVHSEKSNQSTRAMQYTIDLIGPEYFKDKSSMVQQSFKGIPGTAAISAIHGSYIGTGLNVLAASLGPIAQDNPHIVSSLKPFKAINDIKNRLQFAGAPTGTCLYFRDAQNCVIAPLEQLFASMPIQAEFFQKTTWGVDFFRDVVQQQYSILAAGAESKGSVDVGAVSGAASQGKQVFDFMTKSVIGNFPAAKVAAGVFAGAVNALGSLGGGKGGGMQNFHTMDANRLPQSQDPSNKSEKERLYQAMASTGPMITIKVPIQSGILCTVGKGVKMNLLPPVGDVNFGRSRMSGPGLVLELVHEMWQDDRRYAATTTMTVGKGGFN